MATTTQQPQQIQPMLQTTSMPAPAPAAPGVPPPATTAAPSNTPDPAMLNDWYSNYLKTTPTTQQAQASTWTPTADATVSGQFNKITAAGSPLMDMAETQAKQQQAQKGLLNSSMAITAGQQAAYGAALPMAQQDASTYARSQSENASALTSTSQFNANQQNQATAQQNQAGTQGFLNQQEIAANKALQEAQFGQQTKLQATELDATAKRQQAELSAQAQRQADQIKAEAEAQNRQLTAAEQQQIRDLEAQAARQTASFAQEKAMQDAANKFTTTRDAALFQQDLQRINAETDAAIRLYDSQNGTKLYDSYREASQQTYDAYISAVQQIQTSDMDANVKTAQIANLQQMFVTRQDFLNTMYTEMPQWAEEWSTFDLSFGAPTPPPAPRPPAAPPPSPTPSPPPPPSPPVPPPSQNREP